MSDAATYSAYRIEHLLGEGNYSTWVTKMTDILTNLSLYEYPTGEIPRPAGDTDTPAILAWIKNDRQALSAIRLRVADSPMVYISTSTTSKQAWDTLSDMFAPKGAIAIVLLRRKLMRAQCEQGSSIEEHIRDLTSLRQKLAALNSKLTEAEFSITLLTSLPDSWDSFIQGIDTTTLDNSTKLIARILEQDRRLEAKPNADEVALTSTSRSNDITCYHCGRKGHIKSECHDFKAGKTYTEEDRLRNALRQLENRKEKDRPENIANYSSAFDADLDSENFAF